MFHRFQHNLSLILNFSTEGYLQMIELLVQVIRLSILWKLLSKNTYRCSHHYVAILGQLFIIISIRIIPWLVLINIIEAIVFAYVKSVLECPLGLCIEFCNFMFKTFFSILIRFTWAGIIYRFIRTCRIWINFIIIFI